MPNQFNIDPEYYSLSKLQKRWDLNLREIQQLIKKHKIRLWACIIGKPHHVALGPSRIIREAYLLNGDELKKYGELTIEELKKLNFSLTPKTWPHNKPYFIAEKEDIQFQTAGDGNFYGNLALCEAGKEIENDGYVELLEGSFFERDKASGNLIGGDIFNEELAHIYEIKCEKKGYRRYLNSSCQITLKDIYIRKDEVARIEKTLSGDSLASQELRPTLENNNETNPTDIDNVIKSFLNNTLKNNILQINPNYGGRIWDKTTPPCRLILHIMCIMLSQGTSLQNITWGSIKDFISDNINGIRELENLCKLEKFNDNDLTVDGTTMRCEYISTRVSEYKKKVFSLPH